MSDELGTRPWPCTRCGAPADAPCIYLPGPNSIVLGLEVHVERYAAPASAQATSNDATTALKIAVLHHTVKRTTPREPPRERLPPERRSVTRVFRLAYLHKDGTPDTMRLYFTASTYDDGRLGEVFIKADRTGTLVSGALDTVALTCSLLLQHGVPMSVVTSKLRHTRYPPAGFTGDSEFPSCTSALALLAQWLDKR